MGNEIEIQPEEDLYVAFSMPVSFNCTKKIPGVMGWRIYFTNGSDFFITDASAVAAGVNFSATLVNADVTTLEFKAGEKNISVQCQLYNGDLGMVIRSEIINITVVGKLILLSRFVSDCLSLKCLWWEWLRSAINILSLHCLPCIDDTYCRLHSLYGHHHLLP